MTATRQRLPLHLALALLALGACRCGDPAPERAWEVGVPLSEMPAAASGELASFVPAGAPFLLVVRDPLRLLSQIRAAPRLAGFSAAEVLSELALSDSGATARALRQRLNELSRLPLPAVDLSSLLDGPLALAGREGPSRPEFLVVKRLSPAAQASWQLGQMLQAVQPTSREVRVERYRGLPLRKVLLDQRQRLTYFVLRDLLVAGTSDDWVKESADLALGEHRASAEQQPAFRAALAETRAAILTAAVDAEALRAEPGRPGLATLALSQLRSLRLALASSGTLELSLQRLAPLPSIVHPELARLVSKGAVFAAARSLDLSGALRAVLVSPGAPEAAEVAALRGQLLSGLAPALDRELLWFSDGLDSEGGEARVRHVLAARLREGTDGKALLASLLPALLMGPRQVEKEGGHELHCAPQGPLCLASAGSVLLVSNSPPALRSALSALDGRTPSLGSAAGADLLYLDAAALAANLERSSEELRERQGHEPPRRAEPLLSALRTLGAFSAELRPGPGDSLKGEVKPL